MYPGMGNCVYVNNTKFQLGPAITVGELIEKGGGNTREYELQRRDGKQGRVVEVYQDPALTINLDAASTSPENGAGSSGPGTTVTEAGGGHAAPGGAPEPDGGPGTTVTEAGGGHAAPGGAPEPDGGPGTVIEKDDCQYFTTRYTGVIHAA